MKTKEFYIDKFKSLVEFHLQSFSTATILYGDNNAGKSNILEALYLIFRRKRQYTEDEMTEKPINFYTGVLEDFAYGFHQNNYSEPIRFKVVLEANRKELGISNDELKNISGKEEDESTPLPIEVEGEITAIKDNRNWARFEVTEMKINDTSVYQNTGVVHFLPAQDAGKKDQGNAEKLFAKSVATFNDCVFFIQSNRDMLPDEFDTNLTETISSQQFKKFLYTLYLSEERHCAFEEINRVFNNEPFSFGEISFAKIGNELEIMIQKDRIRLPIKSLGSGVLQILYIISCIVYAGKKIVCLEELEQNLSPTNQKATLDKLKAMLLMASPPDQFIISSHSPFFYQKGGPDSTYFLANEDGTTKIVARNGEEPIKENNYQDKEVEYYKEHFPGLEDFY